MSNPEDSNSEPPEVMKDEEMTERELSEVMAREFIYYIERDCDFKFSMSEAARIREISRQVVAENVESRRREERGVSESMATDTINEIEKRFLWQEYDINLNEKCKIYTKKEMYQLIKQKYRPERELL